MKKIALVLMLAGCACASGCGTLISVVADEAPYYDNLIYSGVRLDCWAAFDPDTSHYRPVGKVLAIVDIPLSTAADTVCLPYTIPKAIVGRKDKSSNNLVDPIPEPRG